MEKKIPNWLRIVAAVIILFSSIGIYASVRDAGSSMAEAGDRMSRLSSVNGNTVAEHYYKLHGQVYEAMGSAIANSIAIVLIAGIVISAWLICPVIIEHKSDIKKKATEVRDTTHRVAQAIKNENPATTTSHETTHSAASVPICTNCGATLSPGTVFCTQCGNKVACSESGAKE